VLSAKSVLVTVEEVVETFTPRMNAIVIPSFVISAVCLNPKGAMPSYALDYYDRDNEAYVAWNAISKERATFLAWLESTIFQAETIGAR
jgi:glutaconate CoA-transferase subunit A